ncbi:hypothetical protein DVH24_035501 [Malus domestica]|uniref:Uncharacterized protein n=1 Tax=Malus domestica TaxID=3750 RepID=A0A498J7T5_MALDO|nr:hypothetical protein DVH24_035501 [Malus domestica]
MNFQYKKGAVDAKFGIKKASELQQNLQSIDVVVTNGSRCLLGIPVWMRKQCKGISNNSYAFWKFQCHGSVCCSRG